MIKLLSSAAGIAAVLSGGALASTITFNDLTAGSIVTSVDRPDAPGTKLADVLLSGNNSADVIVFDTNAVGNNDNDIRADIEIDGQIEDFGNVLIIGTAPPANDDPSGGTVTFNFLEAVRAISIDVIDITGDVTVTLKNASGVLFSEVFEVDLDTDEDGGDPNYAETLSFGALGVAGVTIFEISYSESGAFDNLELADLPPVDDTIPVPAALPLLLTGAATLRIARGRKKR